ncbi:hypothetical protein FACS1894107_14040 [Planctomycetales bacterium]|nr:hypothetical protein FACS1894107_14040 [Planctomycetales bacterium]
MHKRKISLDDEMADAEGVGKICGLAKSTIFDWVKAGRFLPPLRNGSRYTRWRVDEVRAFRDAGFPLPVAKWQATWKAGKK